MRVLKSSVTIFLNLVTVFFLLLSSAHGLTVASAVQKAGNSTIGIEFFNKKGGKLIRKGCGLVMDPEGTILVYNMLFRKSLYASAGTDSAGPYPVKGICGENKDLKLWKAVFDKPSTGLTPASFAVQPLAVGDYVFMKNPWKNEEDGFLKGEVLKTNGTKVNIRFSSNVPASLLGAPIFDGNGKTAGILTDVNMKKEGPYALALVLAADTGFKEFKPLGILDWKLKLEKEWKESPKGMMHAVTYYILSKDYRSAIPLLEKYMKKVPQSADAYSRLGYCYGKLEKFGESIHAYEQSVALAPDNAQNHFNLGQALASAGRYRKAETALKNAVRMDSDNHWAHYNLGVVYLAMGNEEAAMKEKKILEKLRPNLAEQLFRVKEDQKIKRTDNKSEKDGE